VIDVHHHCLPALDDGPRTLAEAVELVKLAAAEGIETIVATPHVLRGRWQNDSRSVLEAALTALREAVGDTPRLLLGSEYFFAHDMNEMLQSGQAIIPLAGSRYILIEFDSHNIPPLVDQPLYRAQLDGWIPLIAHPERNVVFQAKPDLLASLVALGAKVQVTASSFLGDFGEEARQAAHLYLQRGMVHVVATDAHNLKRRPPRARAAREAVSEIAGSDVAHPIKNAETAMSKEFRADHEAIEAKYKADKEKCKSMTGNAKDVCMKQAKGDEKVAKAELTAKRKGTPHAMYEVQKEKADAAYEVAKEKCDDVKGADKTACKKQASADKSKAMADAKAMKKS